MSDYLDRIVPSYAPDDPWVREALTTIIEAEIAARVVWGADTVKRQLRQFNDVCDSARQYRERAERAEANAATLRVALERVQSWLLSFSVPPASTIREKEHALALIDAALTPRGQG